MLGAVVILSCAVMHVAQASGLAASTLGLHFEHVNGRAMRKDLDDEGHCSVPQNDPQVLWLDPVSRLVLIYFSEL
jgi:hypothetical protein